MNLWKKLICLLFISFGVMACQEDPKPVSSAKHYPALAETFGNAINPNQVANYQNQKIPAYITKDNTGANAIDNKIATLGRVLFYDKKLSVNNQISCASCHQQQFAFGDTAQLSLGINGRTKRHSMRLVNARFARETHFFWDERATTLEHQVTEPIKDHIEMGYSGKNGGPDLDDLLLKLAKEEYYKELALLAFGDKNLNETRLKMALAQFVRSIQSFDSKYDEGRAVVGNDRDPFPNFSALENEGKRLFRTPMGINNSTACSGCHNAPEFDIAQTSGNNGVIGVANQPGEVDLSNTRAPTIRDLVNPQGQLNGPLMHNGQFPTLRSVIEHYNNIPNDDRNTNLDFHLRGPNGTQKLFLEEQEKKALIAFLKTLTSKQVYTDPKYSDPFR